MDICEKVVIIDGWLCSLLKSMSNTNGDDELAAATISGILEKDIKTSYFSTFKIFRMITEIRGAELSQAQPCWG